MADCSQLQLLLSDVQQDRAALDDPDTYCQDQCDPGDIECIRQCHESIPQKKAADDAAIALLQDEVNVCGILLNVWQITANNLTGQLTFDSLGGTISDISFGLSGTITFNKGSSGPDTIVGIWDERAQILVFQSGSDGNLQLYTGSLSPTPTPTLQGTFTTSASPQVLAWSATR